jgi:hypothetical protein
MNGGLTRRDWKEAAGHLLRQVTDARTDLETLFPHKEHLAAGGPTIPAMKDNLQKLFSKPLESLVSLEAIETLLRRAPPETTLEEDPSYLRLKRLQQAAYLLQLQARDLLASRPLVFAQAKSLLAGAFGMGVAFTELAAVKLAVEEGRRLEASLLESFLSLDELAEMEERLGGEKQPVDTYFLQLIEAKRSSFTYLHHRIVELLSKQTLSVQELRTLNEIMEEVNKVKFKITHFRYLCDLRDSFRWVCLLDCFLSSSDWSRSRFDELVGRKAETFVEREVHLGELERKLAQFVESLKDLSDLHFFRIILDPVRNVEITDASIQRLMDFVRSSQWTLKAKCRISSKTLSVSELEELALNKEAKEQKGVESTFQLVSDLYHKYQKAEERLETFVTKAKEFLSQVDENKICFTENQTKISDFCSSFQEIRITYQNELEAIPELMFSKRYRFCEAFIAIVTCSSKINLRGTIDREELTDLDKIYGTADEKALKSHPLVAPLLNLLNEKKIIQEFIFVMQSTAADDEGCHDGRCWLKDKVKIDIAQQYLQMLFSEQNPVDYEKEKAEISQLLMEFESWEAETKETLARFGVLLAENDDAEPELEQVEVFREIFKDLLVKFKRLRFYSDTFNSLMALDWQLTALEFSRGRRRKRYEWEHLLKNGREHREFAKTWYSKVASEIAAADKLKLDCHETYMENISYKTIKAVKAKLEASTIDMTEEVAFFKDRYQSEEEVFLRISAVINNETKMRLAELEKLAEEVKTCGIDFEDLTKKLDKTIQLCKAFLGVVKEMNPNPIEVKKAKHFYLSIPLFSSTFSAVLKQVEDEEALIDTLNDRFRNLNALGEYSKICRLDQKLAAMKYYNAIHARIILFKQKVAHLIKVEALPPGDFHLTFKELVTLRQDCEQFFKVTEEEADLMVCYSFLMKLEKDAERYLEGLGRVGQPATLDKVPRIVSTFIDVSQEIFDMQAKLNLRSFSTNDTLTQRDANSGRYGQGNGTVRQGHKSKRFDLSIGLPQREHYEKPNKAQAQTHEPIVREVPQKIQSSEDEEVLDIHTARSNLTMNLKMELQINPVLNISDVENYRLAQAIEKSVFLKSLDGSYMTKMPKILSAFHSLTKLKRLSRLVSVRDFNPTLLLYLSSKPSSYLHALEKDKERLVRLAKKADAGELEVKELSPGKTEVDKVMEKEVPVPTKPSQRQHSKREELSLRELAKLAAKKRKTNDFDEDFQEEPVTPRDYLSQLLGNNSRKEARRDPHESRSASEKKTTVVRHQKLATENNVEQTRGLRGEKKKQETEGCQPERRSRVERSRNGGHPQLFSNGHSELLSKVADIEHQPKEVQASRVYKGPLIIDIEGKHELKLRLEACDLITYQRKEKIRLVKQIASKVEFRHALEHINFVKYVDKLLSKQQDESAWIFGFLKTPTSTEALKPITVKHSRVFYVKYHNHSKLFLFHRTVICKSWLKPFELEDTKLISKEEYFWLMVTNHNDLGKDRSTTKEDNDLNDQKNKISHKRPIDQFIHRRLKLT